MGNIATGFSNSNGVRMVACTVGISRGICLSCLCRNHIIRSVSIVTSGYAVVMIAINATGYIMIMGRQFSDSTLNCSTPTINRYIRLQVIVRIIRASVTNSYGMSMCTSLFGCFCALIRTP